MLAGPGPESPIVIHDTREGRSNSISSRGTAGRPNISHPRVLQSPSSLDRKPSNGYTHHRQTSIVHGLQHMRSPSNLAPNSPEPVSPRIGYPIAPRDSPTQLYTAVPSPHLRKSPSSSTLATQSSPTAFQPDLQATVRRHATITDRSHTARPSRDPEKRRAASRQKQRPAELTTVGEYALHHLLTNFIKEADDRIERCMNDPSDPSTDIEAICGPGADQGFDQLIRALGHIGRDRPKSLIDSVMLWRRGKGDENQRLHKELERIRTDPMIQSYNDNLRRAHANSNASTYRPTQSAADIAEIQAAIRKAERRSAISVYILCRVLMEIISRCRHGTLPDETADRLEEVIWMQVRTTDAVSHGQSTIKQAQWNMFGQLLGVMSGPRFQNIRDRYLNELGAMQPKLSVKGHMETELERKAALLVGNMSWLKVRITPDSAWDQSCDLIKLLANYFAHVHGRDIKHAYCQLIEDLLLPIAAKATAQLNSPKWKAVLESLRPKINELLLKPKHWIQAFPLLTVTLCASPSETFSQNWLSTAAALQPKLRDRSTRSHALKSLCRLVWRYLYRMHDPHPAKRLDEIVRLIFIPGRRSILSTEPSIADPLIQLIRIIGFRCQDFCFRSILFPLMNADIFLAAKDPKDLKTDVLDPERMVIGIRAYLAIMSDLERQEQPNFPLSFECDALLDPYNRSPHSHRRSVSQSSVVLTGGVERLSGPINTATLSESTKASHAVFCKILGDICIMCDNAFGGQVVLDEKLAQTAPPPKTPMAEAFAFGRREELYNPNDVRQSFYDLLHVAVQALPRCIRPETPFNPIVNLLCTGTAHMQSHIASSSASALRSIAKDIRYSQLVSKGFSRFIFSFNDKYATVADGGLLGAQHIESTLRLYVELLEIWIERLQEDPASALQDSKRSDSAMPQGSLIRQQTFVHVDEVEAHGLFFLSSPSRHVRSFAIRVLRLVSKFDEALGRPSTRIISVLDGSAQKVIDVNDEKLTTAERSRLQKGLHQNDAGITIIELCTSDQLHDAALWVKAFPGLIRLSQEICPQAVSLTRELICAKLIHVHAAISKHAEPQMDPHMAARYTSRHASSPAEVTIEQWKLHLIYACTTLTNSSPLVTSTPASGGQHSRSASKPEEKITCAAELFTRVVSFLGATNERVREAAAEGLGTIGAHLFRPLMEALSPLIRSCADDGKQRLTSHNRAGSTTRRAIRTDWIRTEITHLYRLTTHCLSEAEILDDEWILQNLVNFTKELRIFLNDNDIQHQLMYQKLRTHFCGLIEALYEATGKTKTPLRWMPFQSRKAAFSIMEEWCGHSPNQSFISQREDMMKRNVLDNASDASHRGGMTAALEIEKKELRMAALSAMAALCAGPVAVITNDQTMQHFDKQRMLQWIDTIFKDSPGDKTHAIGRRALKNLIMHNPEHTTLLTRSLEMCYLAHSVQKTLTSYFDVVTQVLHQSTRHEMPFWKVLCAGLYTLGNDKSDVRVKSIRMLRALEERIGKNSKLQDLDISVSDKTTAVYKLAQFQASQRLSKEHSSLAFHVFSEFSNFLKALPADHQRNMVTAMLPWLQTIVLQIDPQTGRPTASSHILLVNLVEITVHSGAVLHNEVQALWQALATGPHGGNVQVILDFIIAVCLDRKEQNFVDYAKQVVVFLSGTPAGSKVIDFLILQLTPRSMINDPTEQVVVPADLTGLPYIADLNELLPTGTKQSGLSLGQLSLMLLVDLIVSPVQLSRDKIPVLLQTVITQWDHYTPIVQEQAREMLVHLIHELVISKIEPGSTVPDKSSIEALIESIRQQDPRVTWKYAKSADHVAESRVSGVPESMVYLIEELVRVFSISFQGQAPDFNLQQQWAKTTLEWATSCPVLHIACRSFQIYRCIVGQPDDLTLSDMLSRLGETIAGHDNDYLTFSREILMTLRTIIKRLEPVEILSYPQLFWITAASLDTIYEEEFGEGLAMLEQLLDRLDLSDPGLIRHFHVEQPPNWEGQFEGLQSLVYKGLRSGKCLSKTLEIMERIVQLPSSDLVGKDDRLLFTTLANLPRFLLAFDSEEEREACGRTAEVLADVSALQGHGELATVMQRFVAGQFKTESEFLSKAVPAVRLSFFPSAEFESLVFLIGLLNNAESWLKIKTMKLLCIMLPDVDMRKPEFASQGPDMISPLLRLLQTSYCPQALNVLDNVMSMTGTPLDQKHIRMSMAGSHSSRATRKEYDSTKSLYGIPEESGWSIPMPAIQSARVRNNVQAIARTCARPGSEGSGLAGTPKVEFMDDQHYSAYFPDRDSEPVVSPDSRTEGTMSELVMKLDSLDDFFNDPDDDQPQGRNSIPRYSNIITEDRETLYDMHTLPILHKSLDRNASITSFQGSFADPRYNSSSRDQGMNPSAFSSSTTLNGDSPAYATAASMRRPNAHSRSITSPAPDHSKIHPLRSDSYYTLSGDDADDSERQDILSDDDYALTRQHTMDDSWYSTASPADSGHDASFARLARGDRKAQAVHRTKNGVSAAPHANMLPPQPNSATLAPSAAIPPLPGSRPPMRRVATTATPEQMEIPGTATLSSLNATVAAASAVGLGLEDTPMSATGKLAHTFSPVSTFSPFGQSSSAPPMSNIAQPPLPPAPASGTQPLQGLGLALGGGGVMGADGKREKSPRIGTGMMDSVQPDMI